MSLRETGPIIETAGFFEGRLFFLIPDGYNRIKFLVTVSIVLLDLKYLYLGVFHQPFVDFLSNAGAFPIFKNILTFIPDSSVTV
jgi:hypothetical protein